MVTEHLGYPGHWSLDYFAQSGHTAYRIIGLKHPITHQVRDGKNDAMAFTTILQCVQRYLFTDTLFVVCQ